MKRSELLAPAGDFEIAKTALYSGADALYLATKSFGARAYAKNLSLDELASILNIAHVLGKKVYVTVNTIIKENELEEVYSYLDTLYLMGVDAIIAADIAVYMYVINNLSPMEAHISTQVGVKDLNDALFFESIGAKRVVIARETCIEEIRKIKEKAQIDLEVFIHGALCVSYSGGCLMSSMLSLRSGNRGRCSQNCRREYTLYHNGKRISDKAFLLSMKDLCLDKKVIELQRIGVDSLKMEGRMKNADYVKAITKYYRQILDGVKAKEALIKGIFHRPYTKGFIFNEDRANMATITSAANEGKKIGRVISIKAKYVLIQADDEINLGDRLRFVGDNFQYITIKELYNERKEKIQSGKGHILIPLDFKLTASGDIYKMIDSKIKNDDLNRDLIPINAFVVIKEKEKINITFEVFNNYFTYKGDVPASSVTKPLSEELIINQLAKFKDTPFYLSKAEVVVEQNLYLPLKSLNEARRKLIEDIYHFYSPKRSLPLKKPLFIKEKPLSKRIVCRCSTKEQYEALCELGIETIFFENVSPYVNASLEPIASKEILVSNYGAINYYKNHEMSADTSFNVFNSDSIYYLLSFGFSHVYASLEASYQEIFDIASGFKKKYGFMAPLDMVIYGKMNLMTLKYCPLKRLNLCGKCNLGLYTIRDDVDEFIITHQKGCITNILNGHTLNLIEYIPKFSQVIERFRLDFTIETKEEVKKIIKAIMNNGVVINKNDTKGYLKRPIL